VRLQNEKSTGKGEETDENEPRDAKLASLLLN
jgi:hypothetical protein